MIKKTMTYTTPFGDTFTDDFYFNLTKAELTKLEVTSDGEFSNMFRTLIATRKSTAVIELVDNIIDHSYGVRSEDGKRFSKDPQFLKEFKETQAFSDLYHSLCTNADLLIEFVEGVLPADLLAQAKADQEKEELQQRMAEKLGTISPEQAIAQKEATLPPVDTVVEPEKTTEQTEYEEFLEYKKAQKSGE